MKLYLKLRNIGSCLKSSSCWGDTSHRRKTIFLQTIIDIYILDLHYPARVSVPSRQYLTPGHITVIHHSRIIICAMAIFICLNRDRSVHISLWGWLTTLVLQRTARPRNVTLQRPIKDSKSIGNDLQKRKDFQFELQTGVKFLGGCPYKNTSWQCFKEFHRA